MSQRKPPAGTRYDVHGRTSATGAGSAGVVNIPLRKMADQFVIDHCDAHLVYDHRFHRRVSLELYKESKDQKLVITTARQSIVRKMMDEGLDWEGFQDDINGMYVEVLS